ncbi:iron complex transport system permease protein [Paenibacillus sp. UNCCL117]|uniref:FecCD family ABC transporter permease n=1 Tax=unclassified Paenibacillus TaxID=185978 RepID=UPI000883B8A8|nr:MULTISPECIES: iron ABC transporter permease [unclassified Paenibacillus]SDC90332.1 iron complex transport system permease protein [Paenibacillus sp. cl123]SFW28811.1 iron complex transport system permease protein [Paenibacillus sp. UNCCL117]
MRLRISPSALMIWTSPLWIALTILLSILYGAKDIDADTIWAALFQFDPGDVNHQIVRVSRLPRVIGALLIGAFLAISGALMQGMTRNYLASPSIMGVSDGAAFAITLCLVFLPGSTTMEKIAFSLIGSAVGVALVFGMASLMPRGMTPVRMAIIGTIIGTFLNSASAALAGYFQVSQSFSFWFNARLHQMDPELIRFSIPFAIVGILIALWISNSITVLSLGDDVAKGLGQRTVLVKAAAMGAVVILTGIAVAIAGKIAFVGLIIPHITRFLVGLEYKRIIPCAAILGGVFLALSDVLSRFLNYPFETPIGVVTAVFGVPFFLYLIHKKGGGRHA